MNIKINITLSEITSDDLLQADRTDNLIIAAAMEAAGMVLLELAERRMTRLIAFCHTGKFLD